MKYVWVITFLLNYMAFKNIGGLKDKYLKNEDPYSLKSFWQTRFIIQLPFKIPKHLKQITSIS